jgi:hypothetical protein
VFRIECAPAERYRVIGSLQSSCVSLLAEALARGAIALDLSEVDKADDAAVRFLASLAPERCRILGCPTWLALWIERSRATAASET